MKVIDLLNKIANGEEVPKKIKFYGEYYTWYDNEYTGNKGYCLEPLKSDGNSFLEINTVYDLNNEVEIIEDKKIEKIDLSEWGEIVYKEDWEMLAKDFNRNCNLFVDKINEIIDYLEEKK